MGLERAKKEGKKLGRPFKLSKEKYRLLRELLKKGVMKTQIAKALDISTPTVYNYIKRIRRKENELKKINNPKN